MRWVRTRVLPEPAPAMTSSGPSSWMTASRWTGLRPSSRSDSPPSEGIDAILPGALRQVREPATWKTQSASSPNPRAGSRRHRPDHRATRGRLARKSLKRSAAVVAFLLVFNHLVVPQLGGARRAIHLLSERQPGAPGARPGARGRARSPPTRSSPGPRCRRTHRSAARRSSASSCPPRRSPTSCPAAARPAARSATGC